MKVEFKLEKETKNKYRFQEVDAKGNPVDQAADTIGTIYVRKSFFKTAPKGVTVTLEAK